jgi:hypothetical protein
MGRLLLCRWVLGRFVLLWVVAEWVGAIHGVSQTVIGAAADITVCSVAVPSGGVTPRQHRLLASM